MVWRTTACPRNCYSTCSMRVEVENGRLRRLEPHPANRATPGGLCLKGLSYVERVHAPDRILTPLRRRADGTFETIDWDAALDLIADRLGAIRDTSGPQSMLYYAASGTKGLLNGVGLDFWRLYGGCTTTYGDLCWPAGLEATRLTLGDNRHNAPWDLENARLIVLWGKNPAETNIHQKPFIDAALDRGARLVVIDPRRTESAERAARLVQPRPGTDGALALAIAHRLIAAGWIDHDFIDRYVHGFEAFAARARGWPPARAAAVTGVPEATIEALAGDLGRLRPVTLCAGFGMQRYTNSGQTLRALIGLLALTGNIGAPGAGWVYANLQSAIFDTVRDPLAFYPPAEPDGVVRVGISTARLGREMLALRDPALRMIWVERGNPVTQNPETRVVLEAFRALDFRVVVEQFMTDTAREADLVLPAKSMFEQTDVIGAYWHPYIQIRQKVLEPPGAVKPETEIYRLLAQRLGLPPELIDARLPGPSDGDIERYLEARLAPFPGLTLDRLREGPVLAPGTEEVAFASRVFPTPSGKIELVSREAAARWGVDAVPDYVEPEESAARDGSGAGVASPYPLYLMTPNTKNRIHSQFNNLSMIRQFSPAPAVDLHPDDAAVRGIRNGDRVRIRNDRGELELPAHLEPGIRPGCVSVTNGWWISEGGTVNVCSAGRETDMGHGAAFHDNLVEVERVDAADGATAGGAATAAGDGAATAAGADGDARRPGGAR
ncbi:MAG: molybdopterin-dependent oxidoreductase [Candidatus Eiseniibacteriota bacterium]|jgi:anaerobic selenocysteine-containing dehydrogenase